MILAQQSPETTPGPDELYDIVVLAPEASIWPTVFIFSVVLLFFIALAILIWHLVKKYQDGKRGPSPAFQAKTTLREIEKHHTEWDANRFSLAISDTLKDYFSAKYADPVRFETTPEFLKRASEHGSRLPSPVQDELREFLTSSDELKFGNVSQAEKQTWPLFLKAGEIIQMCEAWEARQAKS